MLTGDDEVVANVIASAAGLREVYADLLPEEKLGVVRQMEQSAPVGMIAGAGENSPTLAIATSGIALGSVSSDVTREPAGVLLFGGELSELPFALWIAQIARRTTNVGLGAHHRRHGDPGHRRAGGRHPARWWSSSSSFVVTLIVLLAGLRLLTVTRRMPRRRIVAEPPRPRHPLGHHPAPQTTLRHRRRRRRRGRSVGAPTDRLQEQSAPVTARNVRLCYAQTVLNVLMQRPAQHSTQWSGVSTLALVGTQHR